MFPIADTRNPAAVQAAVAAIHSEMFSRGERDFVTRVFGWAMDAFEGKYRDYQPIDARYHDLEHTLQGTLCYAQILRGRQRAGVAPVISQRRFELGLLAILLHDTGYLKVRGDNEGTGAKYTLIHVSRSANFAQQLLTEKGFSNEDAGTVMRMIRCTGVNVKIEAIPFQGEVERAIGYCIGTADLVGQMAAPDYVDKLPILFAEFAESAVYSGTKMMFESAEHLMKMTPAFWEKYVLPKLEKDFQGVYRYLNEPYPDGANEYFAHIEANIERTRRQVAEAAAIAAK
ncbi:MAG: hypothetical protein EBS05_18100 [Proteobacteria bacterium]|jgi:hypothetical protein|nr:hypothetical protein [Pseudomonadota bacterium]